MIKQNKNIKRLGLFLLLALGITVFSFPKKVKLDTESENFYKFARYLFTKNERKIFLNLPSMEERERFIKHFWEIRDPNPYTEENEFKIEMEERFEYVSKYLKEGPVPGWKSDRGRIYILLGPPHSTYQDYNPSNSSIVTGIIYWYYADSRIFIRFIETRNDNFFRMDLRTASLTLLNELENRKYYISTKDDSKFEIDILDFDLSYNSKKKELLFEIGSKKITFDQSDNQMIAKFKIDLIIYRSKSDFSKLTEVKTVYLEPDFLLKKNSKIEIKIPISLTHGKIKIDAIITDLKGESVKRKFIKLKVKK